MSTEKSQMQPTVVVDENDTIVVDIDGAQDEVYGALTSERRRRVLTTVRRASTPIEVEDLARQVTLKEACDPSKMITDASIQAVHISLYHHHLPKLADLGIIEYDPEANVVTEIAGTLR